MSTYDKNISISHEEEGTYHRRQIDHPRATTTTTTTSYPVTTRHIERYKDEPKHKKNISRLSSKSHNSDDEDEDNFQEWTVSKRKVNHKTRQVETRVSRQLLVRGGEVIADSGPQVTTRIKEDNKVEECEKEKTPKNKSQFEALENAPESRDPTNSGLVLGEKKEIQRVSREVREENMQYHDERFKELTGKDVHRKAIQAPHELITINDKSHSASSKPRGKMIHYSNKGKKYQDTDEILEVAKLAIDGSITKEVKRTNHHEEFSEDELPDEKGEAEKLKKKPIAERSTRRMADYVNDFDDVRAPPGEHSTLEHYKSDTESPIKSGKNYATHSSNRRNREEDKAFPRYEIDPLLNSLRDEDFRPSSSTTFDHSSDRYQHRPSSGARHVEHNQVVRHRSPSWSSSSSGEIVHEVDTGRARASRNRHSGQQQTRARSPSGSPVGRVEVPEEYRVNRQRLLSSKGGAGSTLSQRSNRSQTRRNEDAATQARLTDEEVERQSVRSKSPSLRSHEKATRYLERQSTPNSSRHYYYGDKKHGHPTTNTQNKQPKQRPASISSASSTSSLSSLDKTQKASRKQGIRSRDSGFRSPHSNRTETPMSSASHDGDKKQQSNYAISGKSKQDHSRSGAISPTGSLGRRSVKTTTTTTSMGLADRRPISRSSNGKENRQSRNGQRDDSDKSREQRSSGQRFVGGDVDSQNDNESVITITSTARPTRITGSNYDTISLSSLKSPNATKIQVPYRRIIDIECEKNSPNSDRFSGNQIGGLNESKATHEDAGSSEMSFRDDIERLAKRLEGINQEQGDASESKKQHFDYKTMVANVPTAYPVRRQVIDAYSVNITKQNSPFHTNAQVNQLTDVKDNNNKNQCATTTTKTIISNTLRPENQENQRSSTKTTKTDNNNETYFNLDDYIKYRAFPALADQSLQSSNGGDNQDDEDDHDERMSQISSCSLQSARTYNIRKLDSTNRDSIKQKRDFDEPTERNKEALIDGSDEKDQPTTFDENGNGKPAAWIFDPRDNSSTAIVPPVRPKFETPKIDSKTEELAQSRGGRSYYLELIEPKRKAAKRMQDSNEDESLYSRWNSQGALNHTISAYRPLAPAHFRQNTLGSTRSASQNRLELSLQDSAGQTVKGSNKLKGHQNQRRQLPFSGPPSSLGDRSKSSSCLLSVTRPSKYSIYGGFRKPGESNKPVPRLSYSRAIGPRSSRVDTTPSAPSRYLKMR